MTKRSIATVVRKIRLKDLDEVTERRTYWTRQSSADRLCEVESLRRLWIEITGDPDLPIARVVSRRRLGEPAVQRPSVQAATLATIHTVVAEDSLHERTDEAGRALTGAAMDDRPGIEDVAASTDDRSSNESVREDLRELLQAYEEAISQRGPAEGWFIKSHTDAFVVCRANESLTLELDHQPSRSSEAIELVSIAEEGDGRALLVGSRLIGPLRVAVDGSGRLCLRATFRNEWGALGALAFAASVLDASVRLTREAPFRSIKYAEHSLEVRIPMELSELEAAIALAPGDDPKELRWRDDVRGVESTVERWLGELAVRFIQTQADEWQVQTFGASGVGYTARLNLLGDSLIVLSYGSPNDHCVVDDSFVQGMLRDNDNSGITKLVLVTYSTGREAPTATIEWPVAALTNSEALGRMVTTMTGYLDHLWDELRSFFVSD